MSSHPPAPRRRPTIADVARRAGVSAAAVSFAVNDRPGVSSGTRERILAAARELGWQPSASARALTEARTRAVGLVLARDAGQLESDSFFIRFLAGLQRSLTPADYALLLQIVPGGASAALPAYERLAAAGRVDGLLLTDIEPADPRFELLSGSSVPVVLAGRPASDVPFGWVEPRHAEGIELAVEHCVALGHSRIGFFCGSVGVEFERAREAAWRRALAAAGLDAGPFVAVVARSPRAADPRAAADSPDPPRAADPRAASDSPRGPRSPRDAALDLLRDGPSAVVCSSDSLAIDLIAAARSLGLGVPGDLSVIGFDDSTVAAFATPPLTSVRVDYAELGAAAADLLLATIAGEAAPGYSPSGPELVVRASTARRRLR